VRHAIVYIPGLGDHNLRGQRAATFLWRRFGVYTEVCQMNWIDKQPFEPKLQKILDRIDQLHARGFSVSLVGVSAGASAAVHVFAKRADVINKLVIICGAIQHPEEVQDVTKRNNPAFWESMLALHAGVLQRLTAEQRERIVSFVPKSDEIVDPKNMRIDGISYQSLPTHGHVASIVYAILIAAKRVARSAIG
jgi:pimeloyl-ACP methyl ester carboxylesterase